MQKFIYIVSQDNIKFKIEKIKKTIKDFNYKKVVILTKDNKIYKDINHIIKIKKYTEDTLLVIDNIYTNNLKEYQTKNILIFISIDSVYDILQIFRYINNGVKENDLPVNKKDFAEYYFNDNIGKIVTFGYIVPGSVLLIKLASFIAFMGLIIQTIKTKINLEKLKTISFIRDPLKYYETIKNIVAFQLIKKIPLLLESNINDILILEFLILAVIILFIMSSFIKKSESFYKSLNIKKLKKDISNYVSVIDKNYSYKYFKHKTYYNNYQISEFIKLAYTKTNIDYDKISDLNPKDFFNKISSIDFIKECLKLDNRSKNDLHPEKFKKIKEMSHENTVVYTNFSYDDIKKYIGESKIIFIQKKDLSNKKDFSNIKTLHLLEPFVDTEEKIKLIDMFTDKNLVVHQWYCSVDNFSTKIKKSFLSLITKFKYKSFNITDFTSTFEKNITPGEVIIKNEQIIKNIITNEKN